MDENGVATGSADHATAAAASASAAETAASIAASESTAAAVAAEEAAATVAHIETAVQEVGAEISQAATVVATEAIERAQEQIAADLEAENTWMANELNQVKRDLANLTMINQSLLTKAETLESRMTETLSELSDLKQLHGRTTTMEGQRQSAEAASPAQETPAPRPANKRRRI